MGHSNHIWEPVGCGAPQSRQHLGFILIHIPDIDYVHIYILAHHHNLAVHIHNISNYLSINHHQINVVIAHPETNPNTKTIKLFIVRCSFSYSDIEVRKHGIF